MKRTIILLVIFAALAGGTTMYLSSNKDKGNATYKPPHMDFAVDPAKVHKVFINDRTGKQVLLTKHGDEWLIDNKFKARQNAIDLMLSTMGKLEVKYRPSKNAIPIIVNEFTARGIEVEIYDKQDQMLKNYYIGSTDKDGTATYMIMAGAEEPFAMHIPTFVGNLKVRFMLNAEDWRDKAVFSEKLEDIKSVSVEYPKQKEKSFKLEVENGIYKVEPFYDVTPAIQRSLAPGKAEKYLTGFESVIAEGFQNEHPKRDSIAALLPFCEVIVTKHNGDVKAVRFFPFTKIDKHGNPVPETPGQPVFRLNAACSWGDFMLVQQEVFKNIFWSYEAFFEPS